MDRLERLVNLVAALIDTDRPLTRAEIRERIDGYSTDQEAFRRNFERDKELLRHLGLPLATEPMGPSAGEEVGYRIPRERYELPDPGLDDDELAALRLAASAVQLDAPWAGEAVTRALRKLGGAVGGPIPTPGGAGPARLAELPGGDAAASAFAAIGERRRLRFFYRGQERVVDPWGMSFRRGHWYLSGFDHGRGGERLYRLDRAEGPVAAEGPLGAFERPSGAAAAPLPAWRLGDDDEVLVELLVDPGHERFARDLLAGEAIEAPHSGGGTVFRFPVSNSAAFRTAVLDFLDHAEVLGPPQIRAEFVAWLKAIAGGSPHG